MDVSPPLKERQLLQVSKQTPAIALVLRKLKELMPPFCTAMSESQFIKCCSLLASAMESSMKNSHAHYSSPIFGRGSTSPASPNRSPIRAWLTGGTLEHGDSNNSMPDELDVAAAIETNLEVFFLLTGVEAMYTSLAHVNSATFATLLATCYEHAIRDLQLLRLNLSDAFLMRDGDKDKAPHSTTGSSDAVAALTDALSFLVAFCQVRIKSIQLQSALWHSSPNFADMAALFESLLPNLQQMTPSSIVEPLHASVVNELGAWSSICRTAFFAQSCR
jgi:hypothetical protein